jgi:hypothetical protein
MGKKLFIILLILFAALYLGALAFGVATLESDSERENGRQDMSAGDRPFLRFLDKPLSLLAPPLLLRGLECNGQPVAKMFRLTESASACTLTLSVGTDQEFRRGEVKTYGSGVTIWWAVEVDGERPKGCKDPEEVLRTSGLRLILAYEPQGEDSENGDTCWLKQDRDRPASITVAEAGGSLSLSCSGCEEENDKNIRLRLK